MEHKAFPNVATKVIDADQGIVESIITVFGILDGGNDIAHPGSFKKTLQERGSKVRVLDSHRTDSVMRVLGKPLEIREIGRAELPASLLEEFPEASGGVLAKTQFLMDTEEGRGAFLRIKAGALQEWSYGYDAVDVDYTDVKTPTGESVRARNLRQVRLYEYSPVLWGMVPGTSVVSAKEEMLGDEAKLWHCVCPKCGAEWNSDIQCSEATCPECGHMLGGREAGTGTIGRAIVAEATGGSEPGEAKPWRIFPEEDQYLVYRVDDEGNRVGEPVGRHDTQAEAEAQLRALYANEPGAGGKGATGATGLPLAPRERPWDADAAEGRVRSWAGATDAPNAQYRRAFFWYDASAPDQFGSYKLQFADVIDGTLTAVPRAIFAVAAVLQGSRGGVDLPAGDVAGVRGRVAAYYARMRSEFDDDGIVPPWEAAEKAARPDAPRERGAASGDDAEPGAKVGRVLAARNAERIGEALARLLEVLEDAGIDIPGFGVDREEIEETEEKADQPASDAGDDKAPEQAARPDAAPRERGAASGDEAPGRAAGDDQPDEQAGPDEAADAPAAGDAGAGDEPPTSEDLLKAVELELEEIDLLTEV